MGIFVIIYWWLGFFDLNGYVVGRDVVFLFEGDIFDELVYWCLLFLDGEVIGQELDTEFRAIGVTGFEVGFC